MSDSDAGLPLSPWGNLLSRSQPPRQRLDAILSTPGSAGLVRRMPVEDFYFLVKDLGIEDSIELLGLASPEQIRGCLDFDVWERDGAVPARLLRWLQVLAVELLPARFAQAIRSVDIELLALLLARSCRIHDRTLGEEPEEGSSLAHWNTPDSFYTVEFDTDPETAQGLEQLLDRLYAVDMELARRLVLEAKWGLASELEEASYRWRTGRMADLGFIDYFEAVEVYRRLDPDEARRQEQSRWQPAGSPEEAVVLPAVFASCLADDSFFSRAVERVKDAAFVENLGAALMALLNRVLSADLVDPAALDHVQETIGRARDTLSLGLEFLTDGDLDRAADLLERVPPLQLFRVGFSLTEDLRREARALCTSPEREAELESLLRPRPLFPRVLDNPPGGKDRPFRSREDLRRAVEWLRGKKND